MESNVYSVQSKEIAYDKRVKRKNMLGAERLLGHFFWTFGLLDDKKPFLK